MTAVDTSLATPRVCEDTYRYWYLASQSPLPLTRREQMIRRITPIIYFDRRDCQRVCSTLALTIQRGSRYRNKPHNPANHMLASAQPTFVSQQRETKTSWNWVLSAASSDQLTFWSFPLAGAALVMALVAIKRH